MRYDLSPKIDYSKMTEEEFFEFLDSESKKIKERNFIVPLSDYHKKYAVLGTENEKKSHENKI
jgi:hypothetical protein